MYLLDIVKEAVTKLGGEKPGMFQVNGTTYFANMNALGGVRPTVSVPNELIGSWRNAIEPAKEERHGPRKPIFTEGDAPLFEKFPYDPDTGCLTFQSLREYGTSIAPLQDEHARVPIISSMTSYHSHKHGYAADGTDNWIIGAHTVSERRYRNDATEAELATWQKLFTSGTSFSRRSGELGTESPLAFIMTQAALLQFPRAGYFEFHNANMNWDDKTNVNEHDGWPTYIRGYPNMYDQNPFAVNVTWNAQSYRNQSAPKLFRAMEREAKERLDTTQNLKKVLEGADATTRRLNGVWQFIHATEHANWAWMREEIKEPKK